MSRDMKPPGPPSPHPLPEGGYGTPAPEGGYAGRSGKGGTFSPPKCEVDDSPLHGNILHRNKECEWRIFFSIYVAIFFFLFYF